MSVDLQFNSRTFAGMTMLIAPPECRFHSGIKSEETVFTNNVLYHVYRALVGARFILESREHEGMDGETNKIFVLDFHKFKRYDHKTFLGKVRKEANMMLKYLQ
jgi:hypothetical protein